MKAKPGKQRPFKGYGRARAANNQKSRFDTFLVFTAASFSGLKALQELAGKRFRAGILLYTGKGMAPFGKQLAAIPVSALWKRQA